MSRGVAGRRLYGSTKRLSCGPKKRTPDTAEGLVGWLNGTFEKNYMLRTCLCACVDMIALREVGHQRVRVMLCEEDESIFLHVRVKKAKAFLPATSAYILPRQTLRVNGAPVWPGATTRMMSSSLQQQ